MKQLKFDHQTADLVRTGKRTATIRLFDDKDLSVNDRVALVDKVDQQDPASWKIFGTATIQKITQKRLADLTSTEAYGQGYASKEELIGAYKEIYGSDVSGETPGKLINFELLDTNPDLSGINVLPQVAKVVIYADGGSRGNPGPSASGYVIFDEEGSLLVHKGVYLGVTTNNQAEYTALKLALEEAKMLGAVEADVFMDSLLVVNQMKGQFKVKNRDLWPIHDAVKDLCKTFRRVAFTQVPRELNKLADSAVNEALDRQLDLNLSLHQPTG